MRTDDTCLGLADAGQRQYLLLSRAKRHRLVAGSLGTAIGGAGVGRFARGLLGNLLRRCRSTPVERDRRLVE